LATILIIVSIAVTNIESESAGVGTPPDGISPAIVAGGGAGAPADGISPANETDESAQASAAANMNCFIFYSFVIEDARTLAIIPDTFEE
jgi:hypothetical protein